MHGIDSRLVQPWLAKLLLASTDRVPAVPGGWLDENTGWRVVFAQALGLAHGAPDAVASLDWSRDEGSAARFGSLPTEARAGFAARLRATLGPMATPLVGALEAGHGAALLPLGLACEVLFPEGAARRPETLKQAVVRLETWLGGHTLTLAEGKAWREAALTVLERLPEPESAEQLRQASAWLETLKVPERASGRSGLFRGGLDQRLAAFGTALSDALESGDVRSVESSLASVEAHREASRHDVPERLRMALRALRWLHAHGNALPETLAEAVRWHGTDGAFDDRARRHLLGAESPQKLVDGTAALRRALQSRRDAINERFASLLARESEAPIAGGFVPVERFLDDVVCRLPPKRRALVIVLDGMDGGTFSELAEDLEQRRGWVRHAHAETDAGRDGMLVVLPTVTEFSRSALLTGRLGSGDQRHEKRGFAAHPGIAARSQGAPVLFHKGDLGDEGGGGLSQAVREAIADGRRGVVGVVINAVDDHLAKSEQLRLRRDVAAFRSLGPLLDAAELAARTVILTADHGHVLEANAEPMSGGGEERWRRTEAPTAPGEIEITGPRLERGTGLERAVLLWTERARYCRPKAGYHGGASVQEVVVPLAVYTRDVAARDSAEMEGWQVLPPATPAWWFSTAPSVSADGAADGAEAPPARPPRRRDVAAERATAHGQIALFDEGRSRTPAPVVPVDAGADNAAAADTPPWVRALLDGEVYAAQRQAADRRAPPDTQLEALLAALDRNGGRLPETMLARALGIPASRTRTVLAAMRAVLNVDQVPILSVDDSGSAEERTVRLERELLARQFELDV